MMAEQRGQKRLGRGADARARQCAATLQAPQHGLHSGSLRDYSEQIACRCFCRTSRQAIERLQGNAGASRATRSRHNRVAFAESRITRASEGNRRRPKCSFLDSNSLTLTGTFCRLNFISKKEPMGTPLISTIKKLFAVSGNKCAFPKCTTPLVDISSKKVIGEICHIKAQEPGGPRFDKNQSEEDRQSFDNLILLCPNHHVVVDSDPEAYTVERLTKLKSDHQNANPWGQQLDDASAAQFINIAAGNPVGGSIIINNNQMGGQVAHSIVNIGSQPRKIPEEMAEALINDLRSYPSETVDLHSCLGDAEGFQLATALKGTLESAGWTVRGVNLSLPIGGPPCGMLIEVPAERPALGSLLGWATAVGLKPEGKLVANSTSIRILVGSNPIH